MRRRRPLAKNAVGEKGQAVEVVAAKSLTEQACAPKARITVLQSDRANINVNR